MNNNDINTAVVESDRILYTPSDFAKTSLLYLQEAGQLQAHKVHSNKRCDLSSYLFFTVVSGKGSLHYNGNIYRLSAGDCVFIDCSKPYEHQTSEELWNLKWIHFYGSNMNSIYYKYINSGGTPYFRPIDTVAFERRWKFIYDMAVSDDYLRDMRICEGLMSLLVLIMSEVRNTENRTVLSTKRRDLQRIREYLDQHFQEHISLDQLSAAFFINKYYLTRLFKNQFGVSINTYLIQKRITYAKQLLRFSDESLANIGEKCGIGAPNYFSRLFKKSEGISPGNYRKLWSKQ